MPRLRKPTALKLIDGNPGKRPINRREVKPTISARVPSPPSYLDRVAANEWRRIAPELHVLGLLTNIDKAPLATYCQAFSRWRAAEDVVARMKEKDQLTDALMIRTKSGNAIQNPVVGTANRAMLLMVRIAAEFGMTPAARARIEAGPHDNDEGSKARRYF